MSGNTIIPPAEFARELAALVRETAEKHDVDERDLIDLLGAVFFHSPMAQ